MQKLTFKQFIKAPVEKVWETMLGDETYREWTMPFSPKPGESSHYEGNWEKGSKIMFLDSSGMGMLSRIADNRLYEFISIEHIGFIKNGVEDTTSDEVKKWTPAFENYTFTQKDGGTEVLVEMDSSNEYVDMFTEIWPKALAKLKEIAEK